MGSAYVPRGYAVFVDCTCTRPGCHPPGVYGPIRGYSETQPGALKIVGRWDDATLRGIGGCAECEEFRQRYGIEHPRMGIFSTAGNQEPIRLVKVAHRVITNECNAKCLDAKALGCGCICGGQCHGARKCVCGKGPSVVHEVKDLGILGNPATNPDLDPDRLRADYDEVGGL